MSDFDIERAKGQVAAVPKLALPYLLDACDRVAELQAEQEEMRAVLRQIADQQPKTLEMIRANGFVFKSIGKEPGNWQHLAFSIYTDLCEVDTWARNALGETLEERLAASKEEP